MPHILKKKTIRKMALLALAVAVIAGITYYNYDIDKINIKGKTFGNALKSIQDELKNEQNIFEAKREAADGASFEEFAGDAQGHFASMQAIIDRYGLLEPPAPYESAVKLFKLSTQSQLERDRQEVLFIQTGKQVHETRAKELHQESFEYELAALADYKAAQIGQKP